MRIAFNPSTVAALTSPPNNKDITFDLRGQNIFARGVKFYGTDTNTWRDIKVNNVSIGSHTLDLRHGSNTTLTNTNGVVTINSTWRPVVDNLTSNSTTSSLSANQGRVLKSLIDSKSDSDHNHDDRYLKLIGGTLTGNLVGTSAMFSGRFYGSGDDEGIIIKPSSNGYAGLILGAHDGERSIFYFVKNKPFWRYSHGSDNLDIIHPKKSGTIALTSDIPSSLKNPYALTISLNGTSQGPYDGSATKNINITPGSIGAATSGHNHDDRYLRLTGGTMQLGEGLKFHADNNYFGTNADARIISLLDDNDKVCDGGLIIDERGTLDGKEYVTELLRIRDSEFKWRGADILHSGNYSGILDSRYYTESEVNNLLSKKLDRVNLSVGGWNPRGYNLAADYSYNGGDLSISENGGKMYVSIDGQFYQNEGQYRVLDTSDVAELKGDLTVYQYLSATDATWWPLIWGGSSHNNTKDYTGAVYKSHDRLSWQTSSQTLYATNIRTENIKHLSIGGGIYWNPNVESATDGSDVASITLVKSGVAGGTTLVLSQMNDTNDTIQFKTNTAAKLYHNSYPILTTQNTYVNNHKGYIYGAEITQVNNSDTVDGWHKDNIQWTGYITSADTLASYWFKMYEITVTRYPYNDITITFLVSEGYSSHFSIFYLRIRQNSAADSGNYNLSISLYELVGNLRDKVVAYYNNSTGDVQLWGNTGGRWHTMNYTILKKTTRTDIDSSSLGVLTAQSFSSVQTPPSTGYSKVTMSRVGSVSYSDSTGSVHWNNVTNKPGSFTPSSHTHTWASITDKLVRGNEFNIVNAGFKEDMWFNYLPINDGSKTATISGYHFGNGAKGYTAVKASGFIKNGSNDSYVLLGGGGHKTESSLRVAYASSAGSATSATKVIVNQHTTNDINYPLVWSNQANTSNVTENQLYKSWADLYYNPKNKRLTVGGSVVTSSFVKSGGTNQQLLRADGGVAAFNWTGQSGQPTWLWGGNDFNSYYVYNPSNFRVAYATSAGNADTLDGEHAGNFVRAGAIEADGTDLNALDTYSFIKSVNSKVTGHSPKSTTGWYNIIQAVHRNGQADGPSYIGQIALGMTVNTDDMFFRGKRTDPWKTVIHSGNIGSQTVANAYHLRINSANSWSTWNWSGQSGQPSQLWGSNDGTNMYVWNPSNFNVNSAQYLRSLGNKNCQTGRTQAYGDVYTYNTHSSNTGSATTYSSVIGFGRGGAGTVEIAGGWCNTNLYWRSLRDCCEDWFAWRTVLDDSNYASVLNNTYLPLAGGTMKGNARIGHGSGSLYIGNSGNDGWLYVQDMASQAGEANWKIYANGSATFKNLTVNGPTVVNGSTTLNSVTTLNGLVTNNGGILPASYDVNKNNTACYVWGDAMSTGVTAITDALAPNYVSVNYSQNNGSSWLNAGLNTFQTFSLYANNGNREAVYLGGNRLSDSSGTDSLAQVQKNQLMVTFEIPNNLYSQLCWASIDINNGVQTVCTVEIIAKDGTIKNTFTKNLYGWNNLNYINFWGNNSAVVSIGQDSARFVRFKFKHDAGNTQVRNALIYKIRIFSYTKHALDGGDFRSIMANTGHLYRYDENLNVTFPNAIKCNTLNVGSTLSIKDSVIDCSADYISIKSKKSGSLIANNREAIRYDSSAVNINNVAHFLQGLCLNTNIYREQSNGLINTPLITTDGVTVLITTIIQSTSFYFEPANDGQLLFLKVGKKFSNVYFWCSARDCEVVKANNFDVHLGKNVTKDYFADGLARIFIYKQIEKRWYEFHCG